MNKKKEDIGVRIIKVFNGYRLIDREVYYEIDSGDLARLNLGFDDFVSAVKGNVFYDLVNVMREFNVDFDEERHEAGLCRPLRVLDGEPKGSHGSPDTFPVLCPGMMAV